MKRKINEKPANKRMPLPVHVARQSGGIYMLTGLYAVFCI
jgi:hypothetical protein